MNLRNKSSDLIKFYVEIVDRLDNTVAIPFPPYNTLSNGQSYDMLDLIKATTDKVKSGSDFSPEGYAMSVTLLVNPTSLNINMSKIINRTQTMTGWIEEHWGEELDTVTFQGASAAFVTNNYRFLNGSTTDDARMGEGTTNQGVTFYNNNTGVIKQPYIQLTESGRRDSISYKNMKDLVKIFNTNGVVYDPDGFVAQRYYIKISYDYGSYRGYFESFDITEESSNPYRFTYTVTFKVEKTIYKLGTKKWDTATPPQASQEFATTTQSGLIGVSGLKLSTPLTVRALMPASTDHGPANPPPEPIGKVVPERTFSVSAERQGLNAATGGGEGLFFKED